MLKNVKDIVLDSFWIMPSTPEFINDGVPYITSKNIKMGEIDFSKIQYISHEDYAKITKNRPIIVDKANISTFMQEFVDKMRNIGFIVNTN